MSSRGAVISRIRPGRHAAPVLAVALAVLGCGPAESNPAGTDVEKPSPTTSAPRDTPTPRDSPSVAEPGRTEVPEQLQFTATTLDGDGFEGASLVGKPAALWFWAPWCPICRNEGPTVTKLSKAYEGKVSIVGVAGLDKLDAMHEFVSETGVGGIPHLADAQGAVWRHFDITTQSTWVLLDADGKIVHAGRLDADELTAHVRRLVS